MPFGWFNQTLFWESGWEDDWCFIGFKSQLFGKFKGAGGNGVLPILRFLSGPWRLGSCKVGFDISRVTLLGSHHWSRELIECIVVGRKYEGSIHCFPFYLIIERTFFFPLNRITFFFDLSLGPFPTQPLISIMPVFAEFPLYLSLVPVC